VDEQGLWKDIRIKIWILEKFKWKFQKKYASLWWKDLSEVSGEG